MITVEFQTEDHSHIATLRMGALPRPGDRIELQRFPDNGTYPPVATVYRVQDSPNQWRIIHNPLRYPLEDPTYLACVFITVVPLGVVSASDSE